MTGGFNQDGSHGDRDVAGVSWLLQPRDDRETLSALLDGELPGDAARFALKRLSHDVQWRDTCGRWQLIGDAMRGEAGAVAPAGFAAGVARTLGQYRGADATSEAVQAGRPVAARSRGGWLVGAALAASLALAAVLVVKPLTPAPTAQPPAQVVQAAPPPAAVRAPVVAPSIMAGGDALAVAAAAPAAASVPVPSRTRPARIARSAPPVPRTGAVPTPAPMPEVAAVDPVAAPAEGPFQPPQDIATRPWPRAVLPGARAAGGYTVDYEGSTASPFDPFEPQPADLAGQESESPSH
jgi:Meckel syndrome type 1 protein